MKLLLVATAKNRSVFGMERGTITISLGSNLYEEDKRITNIEHGRGDGQLRLWLKRPLNLNRADILAEDLEIALDRLSTIIDRMRFLTDDEKKAVADIERLVEQLEASKELIFTMASREGEEL